MADKKKPPSRVSDGNPSPEDLAGLIGLARLLTNAPPSVPVTVNEYSIPGRGWNTLGAYNLKDKNVKLRGQLGGEFMETLLHELTHAQQDTGTSRPDMVFQNDMVQSGVINENNALDRRYKSMMMIDKMLTDATNLGLASSSSGNFEEVRANAASYKMAKDSGHKVDPNVGKLMEMNPEFAQWINEDLGGKFISSPRMTETPQGLMDVVNSFLFRQGLSSKN